MVLESVVADLLNRFLGDYVENLNKSQLKLGIWGGNVALDNLQIKENALSELDVPFRIKVGQIDKLTLKIPWKNLYGEAVVATLEGLYLLIVPGASIKYDAEKEEKYLQDNKQKELARIEEALQKAAEKDKPKEEKKDTFLEKLATQVIKNVQVKITGIHVRYEDDITDPQCPISLGMTLGELSLLTTNENWTPSILNEAAKIIYKLLCMDSLSAYWNIHSKIYYHGSREQILDQLKRGIPCSGNQPQDYQYIFRPVSASARLYINPYAEVELKTPKFDCNVEVQRIVIEFTKPQYLSMIDLLESIDYMVRNAPYRRFRPNVSLHKNARQWWKYAGNSVLEVHIKRHTRMWSWNNIKQHRQLLKSYKNMYKNKLTQSKLSEETQRQIQDLERKLDVFNIILARQQAQVETVRSGQKLLKKKTTEAEKKSGGWFGGFWGKRESRKKEDEESPVPETIDELMTPEEKAKLFTAIGYSDSSHHLSLPKQYVAHVVTLKLLSTSLTIKEDKNVAETLKVQIIDLSTKISQRPGAQAIKVEAKLENWYVTGLRQENVVPSLVASIGDSKSSLLKIEFNVNPEDSTADQSLTIESQPVEIKYDARTINAMVEFFQTSKGMDLERLTSATLMKLEEIKERTATGLVHIIEMRKVLDLKINLKPSYLVVPQTGFYDEKSDLLILDFGTFQLNSINQGSSQASTFSSLEEIMDKAYDKFDVEIKNVQLLFGRTGEDWKKARFQHPSTLHILQPMDIHVQLAKSMVERDTRMAKFKVSGELPLVHVRLSDQKIKAIFDLIDSIPLPQKSSVSIPSTKAPAIPTIPVIGKGLLNTPHLLAEIVSDSEEEYLDFEESSESTDRSLIKGEEIRNKEPAKEELTDLQLKFEIREVLVELTRQKKTEETVLVFDVMHLGTEATVRTYNLAAVSYLKKISLDYNETGGKKAPVHLISSSDKPGLDLLKVQYTKADRNGPHFQTIFDNTEQMIQVTFSSLNLLLHTEALMSAVSFLTAISPSGNEGSGDTPAKDEKQEDDARLKKVARPSKDKDVFDFKLFAKLDAFCLNICDEKKNIAEIKIQGLDSSLLLQPSHTVFFARLKDIVVTDVDSRTLHKKAVSIVGDEVFSFNLMLDPYATEGEAYTDMSKVDGTVSLKVGCIQIVYLHKFLMSLLTFLNNFQTAKEALSAATVQAAEKAATSVKDLAQRSFRLAMDIHLKAPVVVIPQSSVSPNAIVMDLGLIKVQNQFSLVPPEGSSLPPIIDKMDVQLTKLQLSRTTMETGLSHPDVQILHPINLSLSVKRNLSAAWFHKLPVLEITGYLDTMNIALSEDDLTVVMKILLENLGGASSQPNTVQENIEDTQILKKGKVPNESDICEVQSSAECYTTLKFDFNFESLSVTLYNSGVNQRSLLSLHSDKLRLGELQLHLMASSGKMFSDGSVDINVKLKACTLDDLREGIQNVTARMIDKKDDTNDSSMIDISYKQDKNGTEVVAVLDKLYICASMEFLLTVADFFINSMPTSSTERSAQLQLKHVASGKSKPETEISVRPNMSVKAVVMDPEIVFVANLTNADAPALKVSFQCDFSLTSGKLAQRMTAQVKGFKVLACAFLKEKQDKSVTTVLQPCSLVMENMMHVSGLQTVVVTIEEVTIKISPIILNTVMTIMAAIKPKTAEEDSRGATEVSENLWQVKPIDQCNAWFLGVDVATEATESFRDREHVLKQEKFDVVVKSVQITLECGLGHRTVPLLLVESVFSGVLKNWSSLMEVTADMSLEIHYYNETYAVWEPLIERIEGGKKQWSLKLEMKTNPVQERSLMPGDDFIVLPEPQTAVNISSKDTMNITISKCCLAVFSNLAKAFSEGTASTFDYSFKETAPFIVKNALGVPLKVLPSSNFRIVGSVEKENMNDVEIGQNIELEYSVFEAPQRGKLSAVYRQESSIFSLNLDLKGYEEMVNIPIAKPGRRLYNIRNFLVDHSDSIIVQIDATEGNKVITVRSPLQIKNHFSIPFMIYKLAGDSRLLEPIGISKPEEEFHVPLHSYRYTFSVLPTGMFEGQFKESTTYIAWREELHRSNEVKCLLQCPATETNFLPLIISSTAVPDELNFISTYGEEWDPAYIIHLYPTLTVRNLLPYSLRYLLEGTAEARELMEGSAADVFHSRISGEIMELVLIKYQGKDWNGHLKIRDGMPEFFCVCFTSHSAAVMTVDIYIHTRRIGSRMILSVFSPYWIINKTSRILQYRAEDTHVKHPADYRDIVLFSFKKKNIFSKNKIQLCISTSTWSSSFSLDTVGSYGYVKCSANNMDYLVGVSIKMSSFNLTRIVTFTPFYTIANKSSLELEVGEIGPNGSFPTNKWNYISSSECLPFWPENSSGQLCVRVVGYESLSKPFLFKDQDNGTLLRLEELNGGLLVDVNVSEHSTLISFSDYHEGAAPVLIVNHTSWDSLRYKQSGLQEEMELKPKQVCLFAWTDPTKTRKLTWGYSQNFGEHDLLKDECGQFPYNANTQIHWVSFLDGRQRVLLFTDDVALVSKARQAEELEQPDQEINLSIHSLGLSLVNNENKKEISYIGITSSGVVWELKQRQKWKPFNQKQINLLEQAYQKYVCKSAFQAPGWHKLDGNTEVCFEVSVNFSKVPMEMRLPVRCSIRRNFLSGIQVEFKQSPHQRSLRAQLYWLQVDNQLPGSMFPVVFHPVAPPKSIALDSEPKPFIDISVITRFNEYSKVLQFKYFMVLIQEMALKIDQGFLGALSELFTPSTDPEAERQRSKLIQQDVDALNTELMESSLTDLSMLSFFEHFHISPIKLHLSLSLASGGEASDKGEEMIAIHSLNLLLKSIGATLTDVDDLIFKLAFFEIKYQFYKRDQLMKRVVRHYSEQLLKQMYVLVLGLDVLGNPFGLIRGLSEGVEAFFYEPFQGAVQGPEEFAEGFVIGVKSLLGHTVGGAAGVVSRITGSVGKGLAAITMDKEFQQKRREEMGRQPKDFGDSLAKGGKGLLRGVVGGVTGIITKPVEGAKKEGAAGFFKGIGKGLVGAVARPTGGIVDMASSTFQGIQRVAESTEEVSNLRPPRFIHEDGIIRPYDRVEAEGYDLFEKLHIRRLEKESYRYHCALPRGRRANLIVTNRRVIYVKEVEILGHLTTEWDYLFEDFTRCPSYEANVLKITVLDQRMFQRKDITGHECIKAVQLQDETTARRICCAIQEAQATRKQQKLVKQASLQLKKPQTLS
ncbi:unnamed protein product [Bubo scandiacus]